MKKNNKHGSSLLITLLVIAALMSIAFGISKLAIGELKLVRDVSETLIAYYAADSGAECQMYADRLSDDGVDCSHVNFSANIYFEVVGEDGPSPYYRTIVSNGFYKSVMRSVELTY
jgi:hypothetical protein